ncbi:MAG: hypothetical protein QOI12_4473 [Alphaproteobacteria bacterium]|jgi:hypothetical protein|nr:hypothetical protein [Alphaproteobacteria bacterium]
MRNGQNNKRMRGRNQHQQHQHHSGQRKNHNPMSRVYESNGPDVKIRGNPSLIAEKYMQLARDAQTSGDPISAENYYQHAEHYYRLIAAAAEQFRQNNPHLPRPENELPAGARDDVFEDDGSDGQQPMMGGGGGGDAPFGTGEQPYLPREAQPFPQHQQHVPQQVPRQPQSSGPDGNSGGDVDRLPSFITGGQQPQSQQPSQGQPNYQGPAQNGHDAQGDRFPLHRRRRRHRGPRQDFPAGPQPGGGERDDSSRE